MSRILFVRFIPLEADSPKEAERELNGLLDRTNAVDVEVVLTGITFYALLKFVEAPMGLDE